MTALAIGGLGTTELLIILAVLVLLFGASKLPGGLKKISLIHGPAPRASGAGAPRQRIASTPSKSRSGP